MHSLSDSLRMEQKNKRQCTYTSCSFDLLTTGVSSHVRERSSFMVMMVPLKREGRRRSTGLDIL